MQTRTITQLINKALKMRQKGYTWDRISIDLDVLTEDGRPDPGMVHRIAHGYEPKRVDTRKRIGLPPRCFICGQKVKYVREIRPWLEQAIKNLQGLEARANTLLPKRIYTRQGRRA